ncbi:uncharacterized protein SEPMUDRAFT_107113 [Sphaerulina musiva SO2202]|uniref:PPM-type phosphatase domain-containing protein n=1 Tax=Sphaerulina musiva (strain SO2202) TaxID=692275 RepID=M3C3L6_SPHMS|nr:uncharacterized protein SEPMUDRAFT_107113 [Sphaerulina musiva SO2202]EMF14851.1 hypothetical protein SEPMUDRAFT_107113 [Sphaerulina musiva SO2202]
MGSIGTRTGGVEYRMFRRRHVTTDTVDRAWVTPAVGMALADEILGERSGATDAPNAVTHTCQLPANLPCEDVFYAAVFRDRRHMHKGWGTWAIFDGHAGPWTSEVVSGLLPLFLAPRLDAAEYFKRRYIPNDPITSIRARDVYTALQHLVLLETLRYRQNSSADSFSASGSMPYSISTTILV